MHRPSTSGPGPAIAREGRGGPQAGGNAPRKRPKLRDRLWARIVAALLAVFLVIVGWSVGHAMTMPGGGSLSERLAEWARGHYLGPVVTFGEWLIYQAPKKGGKPSFSLAAPSAQAAAAKRQKDAAADKYAALYGPPAALKSLAGKPLPGEGQWRVLTSVHGTPAIYGTYLRASSVYTSYVAGIAEMNQRLLKFQLRPGTEDPGPGRWKASPEIAPGTRAGLEATFNNGFKIDVSGGGFYLNGATSGTLVKGDASVVYYKDGHIAIGTWGQTVNMAPDVVGVRQNLHLIVINGKIPGAVDNNVTTQWGATLGGGYYVWRSGIGITKDGRVVFVYGPALNVRELAQLLKAAGVVTGMELDINPDWMSYESYAPGHHPNNPTPKNLLPDQMQPAARYFSPSGRDFTAVYAR